MDNRADENEIVRKSYDIFSRSLCPDTWDKFCDALNELCERRGMDNSFMGSNAIPRTWEIREVSAPATSAQALREALEEVHSMAVMGMKAASAKDPYTELVLRFDDIERETRKALTPSTQQQKEETM